MSLMSLAMASALKMSKRRVIVSPWYSKGMVDVCLSLDLREMGVC
jgi:hypothetical protein